MHPDFYLTPDEAALVENASWLLIKHRIIGKVYGVFGALSDSYAAIIEEYSEYIPREVTSISPKIYKGEQYKGLPYVMLDYPRCFSKTDVFAIRSFFWWGNYFSITLQLSGTYLKMYADNIFDFINDKKNKDWYFGVHESEWEHHFEKDNYVRIDELNKNDLIKLKSKSFIKIAKRLSLEDWKVADKFFMEEYKTLLQIICKKLIT